LLLQLVLPAALSASVSAGVVHTADARLEGEVAFADGQVTVGGQAVAWDAVLAVVPVARAPDPVVGSTVRWAGGEVWRADLVALSGGRATLSFGRFGRHEADAVRLAAVDFFPADTPGQDAPGTLFRDQGEPIPGTLLWVDQSRLAIDSPLGVLTLSRQGVMRYVFPSPGRVSAAPASADEVGLMDGSILRGTARPVAGGVQLEHPVLGALRLDAGAVRSVARLGGRAWDLARLVPQSATAPGLLGKASPAATYACGRAGMGSPTALSAMTVQPETALRYRLGQAGGRALAFRARVGPVEGARGDVRLRILAGGKTVAERDVSPGARAADIAVNLPGADIEIKVEFGSRIAFPCAVVLEDAFVVARP
jgi:hypothetical protein